MTVRGFDKPSTFCLLTIVDRSRKKCSDGVAR
jgi:hypothetical protein